MEDIIDIIVTETTNLIEITSQPTDEVIDVNIIDNREDITLNVTPSVVEININSLTGNFGVEWGDITGTLSNQTDLNTALSLKADLVDGKVPSSQLPSYVDDVVEVANYASLPATGEVGKIYITLDTNFIYRWTGSTYVEIKDSSAVWGAITGTLSNQTDLQSALDAKLNTTTAASTYVPYTGATSTLNLGLRDLIASAINITGANAGGAGVLNLAKASSRTVAGSGYLSVFSDTNIFGFVDWVSANTRTAQFSLASITDNAIRTYTLPNTNGTLALTSDLHNAVTIGTANGLSLSTQVLSLGLASSSANGALSSTDWTTFNSKQTALSGTGFVKISGTTISYDSTAYLPLAGGTLTGALFGASASFSGFVGFGGNTSPLAAIDVTGAGIFSSSVRSSGYYLTGMTSGSGALYYSSGANRVTVANYNTSGIVVFEVNGGAAALTLNSNLSATFASTLSATGATLTGALSGTSASFSDTITNTLAGNSSRGLYFTANQPSGINWYDTDDVEQYSVGIIANSGVGYWGVWSSTSSTAIDRSVAIPKFKIANGGAATFSSSVTTGGDVISTSGAMEIQGSANAIKTFYLNRYGVASGSQHRLRAASNYFEIASANSEPIVLTGGNVLINKTTARGNEYLGIESGGNEFCNFQSTGGVRAFRVNNVDVEGFNTTGTTIFVGKLNSSGRSINAGGTINAMGLDYAEYMTKSTSENINKGDIVGIDSNGLLTDLFELSISFGIKSTNPSFVGGDEWGANKEDTNLLEQERQKVDRIAFSGQVPCNVLGANVGDYIIPVNNNGKIKGIAVSNPTFEQYQISVGKVWKIMEDGRAWVAVKIG